MLRDEIQRDLRLEVERDLRGPDDQAQTIVYGTLTLPCTPTSLEETTELDSAGNETVIRHSVLLRTELFNLPGLQPVEGQDADSLFASAEGIPNVGDEVRFRWTSYRVARRRFDAMLATLRLDLADIDSNR